MVTAPHATLTRDLKYVCTAFIAHCPCQSARLPAEPTGMLFSYYGYPGDDPGHCWKGRSHCVVGGTLNQPLTSESQQ